MKITIQNDIDVRRQDVAAIFKFEGENIGLTSLPIISRVSGFLCTSASNLVTCDRCVPV